MPKNKNAFIRYRLIDAAIRNKYKPFPGKSELIDACSGLGSISSRTIDKDIYDMKYDEELGYFAPIEFDRFRKGYYYSDQEYSINKIPLKQEDLYAMEFACSILKPYEGIETVKQFLQSVGKIEEFISMQKTLDNSNWNELIQTERATAYNGSRYLSPLLKCIKEFQVVLLHYQRFGEKEVKVHTFHPYVLKEYRNRWYVCGWSESRNQITTFALERIVELIETPTKFKVHERFSASTYFRHSYGISVTNAYTPEEVVLSFSSRDAYYIKTKPLHPSQRIIEENEGALVVALDVIPSYELKADILSFGSGVKVLKPTRLADEIKMMLNEAIAGYIEPITVSKKK